MTIAEVLRLNGYSTAQLGKCHEVPTWEWSPVGPFDRWPTGSGFEYFYGFIGGETNQFYPSLTEGTTPVAPDRSPEEGYHFTEDIAAKARRWLGQQRAMAPDKPFFLYFAPGATHAPIHVPEDWQDRYAGEFDQGWDVVREQTFARQKQLGIVPPDCELTTRPDGIPAWSEVADAMKPVLARQMELYAAFLEHTDHCIGQLVEAIEQLGELENTVIFVITGDNGASGEGTLNGTWNESLTMTGMVDIETRSSCGTGSTRSARRSPTRSTRSAGHTRWTRRTRGSPQRKSCTRRWWSSRHPQRPAPPRHGRHSPWGRSPSPPCEPRREPWQSGSRLIVMLPCRIRRVKAVATGASVIVLLAPAACASDQGETAADCGSQIRRGERVYTGYAYTDRVGVELGRADRAECHDVGEEAEGSVFSADSPQVTVWSVEGYPPDDVLAVRFDDDSFEVYFSESMPVEDVERIAEELTDDGAG